MPRNWLRLAALLTLLFGAAVALVRVQPYDDPAMRAILTPPHGCEAPCFMGIQPGITLVDDAEAILESNAWIADVEPSARFYDLLWSGAQPDFIDDAALNYFMNESGIVGQIRLRTRLRLGDVVALLGRPDKGFAWVTGSGSGIFHAMIYTRLGVEVSGFAPCPAQRRDLWQMPVEIRLYDQKLAQVYEDASLQPLNYRSVNCA